MTDNPSKRFIEGETKFVNSADRHRILLPISSLQEAQILIPFAKALAQDRASELIVLNVVTVPETDSLSQGAIIASRSRQALHRYLTDHEVGIPHIQTLVRVAHQVWDAIWEVVTDENVDVLVFGWRSGDYFDTPTGALDHPRLAAPPCDLVLLRPSDLLIESGWEPVRRVLLPVRGGPNAAVTLRTANALVDSLPDSQITLLHATGKAPRDAEEQIFTAFGPALRGLGRLSRSVTVVGDVTEAILQEAKDHQAVVMGAPSKGLASGEWQNMALDEIVQRLDATLIIVKEKSTEQSQVDDERVFVESRRERPLSVVVDKWFAENTFHSREFATIEDLLELKEQQGLTISLGLPALNEEKTVGNVIKTIQKNLVEDFPLLDEMVLIDSGSMDYTREIAGDLGIPVYIHQEILPQYGANRGKGEALWKSQYILKGDLIAWIDTDIRNIHPRFVYGIIGPLLRDPNIQYVKGFYRRPIRQGDRIVPGGGGRVTELTARPFINLFYPELSGLIQPLSGEYAGRRSALEQAPFFTGYGVETGLLIDLLDRFGLQAIAQVDLLERVHHNQQLTSLSRMSFTIIQVFMRRLEKLHQVSLMQRENLTMNMPQYSPSRFYLETELLEEKERPPMITLPEYRQQRGLEEDSLPPARDPAHIEENAR